MRNWSAILIDAGLRGLTACEVASEQSCQPHEVRQAAKRYGMELAREIAPRGSRKTKIAEALREFPCATAAEIAKASGFCVEDVSYVLQSMEHAGLVEVAGRLTGGRGPRKKLWRLVKARAA